jgi:hypothetical protein
VGNQRVKVAKQEIASGTIFIEINLLESDKTKLKIEVYSGDKKIETSTTSF